MSKKPVQEFRIGLIKASVWRNQTRAGERHNVTVTRIFKNGDVWKESSQFGRNDLLALSKVVDLAHTWIHLESNSSSDDENIPNIKQK